MEVRISVLQAEASLQGVLFAGYLPRSSLGSLSILQWIGFIFCLGLVFPCLLTSLGVFLLAEGEGRGICTQFGFAAAAGRGEKSGSLDEAAAGRARTVSCLRGDDSTTGTGEGTSEDSAAIWKARAKSRVSGWTPHPWRGKAPD